MINYILIGCLVVIGLVFLLFVGGGIIAHMMDSFCKSPNPQEIKKEWVFVPRKDKNPCTLVCRYAADGEVFGKVVYMDDGMYRAIMYNGSWKEFINAQEAKQSVENYKPHIVK